MLALLSETKVEFNRNNVLRLCLRARDGIPADVTFHLDRLQVPRLGQGGVSVQAAARLLEALKVGDSFWGVESEPEAADASVRFDGQETLTLSVYEQDFELKLSAAQRMAVGAALEQLLGG